LKNSELDRRMVSRGEALYGWRNRVRNLMPKVPKGERRPADVIGNAVYVMEIATGGRVDSRSKPTKRARAKKRVLRRLAKKD
jgi:hypothetical protein